MTLTLDDLNHVLKLAHLDISDADKPRYLEALNNTLGHMNALDALNLDGVDASAYARTDVHYQREDVPENAPDLFLKQNAPEWEEGYFSVPKIGS